MLFCAVVLIMFIHVAAFLDFLIKLSQGWRFIYLLSGHRSRYVLAQILHCFDLFC